ncbi:hypothetical protein E2562_006120 [Oryza meyeriana var. granulata]|uniref:Uncharacterized protein n=1 Tax=Oryza meyeriana var. granulata TaxID=110450 RepID=A0A6G1EVN9_9ORYZ|nr:hypothetical protein E2562_006120 [Oryza meyeriana var. granulata]
MAEQDGGGSFCCYLCEEFIHASADEHKTCFTKTIKKMFGMSKVVTERSAEAKEPGAESVLPLQTTVSR